MTTVPGSRVLTRYVAPTSPSHMDVNLQTEMDRRYIHIHIHLYTRMHV